MIVTGELIPVVHGSSNMYSQLAWIITGRLVTSAILARLFTLVMYKLIPPEE